MIILTHFKAKDALFLYGGKTLGEKAFALLFISQVYDHLIYTKICVYFRASKKLGLIALHFCFCDSKREGFLCFVHKEAVIFSWLKWNELQ